MNLKNKQNNNYCSQGNIGINGEMRTISINKPMNILKQFYLIYCLISTTTTPEIWECVC